jgi:hypothetical protein
MTSNVLRDLPISRNEPLKWGDDQNTGILKNKINLVSVEELKKPRSKTLWFQSGEWVIERVVICIEIHYSVMLGLYLSHDFYNVVIKIKQIVHSLRVSSPPSSEKLWVHNWLWETNRKCRAYLTQYWVLQSGGRHRSLCSSWCRPFYD